MCSCAQQVAVFNMKNKNHDSPCRYRKLMLFVLVILVVVSHHHGAHTILSASPEMRLHGWHAHTVRMNTGHRLDLQQQRVRPGDDLGVTLSTSNLQQCLRLCWLYKSCGVVSYTIVSPMSSFLSSLSSGSSSSSSSTCRLFDRDSYRFVTTAADPDSIVVNMTRAVMKKVRLHGCDTRPCRDQELCMTVTAQDNYKCLPMVSLICGTPNTRIDNGTSTMDGLGYAYYRCKPGFVPSPESVVTSECNRATRQWSPVSLTCLFVDCGSPHDLEGADVQYLSSRFEAVANYRCQYGHHSPSEADMSIRCLRTGRWSAPPSPCILVDCGAPSAVDNGRVELPSLGGANRTFYGGVATQTCLQGYRSPERSVEIICEKTGLWSQPSPPFRCAPVDCGQPPSFEMTTKDFTTTTYKSNVSYSCIEGYQPASPYVDVALGNTTCQDDGHWSHVNVTCVPVDCGRLPDLPGIDGAANTMTFGSVASLQCSNASHIFKGDDRQLTCRSSGTWSPSNASCIPPPCAQPTAVPRARVTLNMTDNDQYLAEYQTHQGFRFNTGNTTETFACVDGFWEDFPTNFNSLPVDCGPPQTMANAIATTNAHTYNSVVTYRCQEGFEPTTLSNQITCLENGSWSQGVFGCEKITCGSPPSVDNSRNDWNVSMSPYSYGNQIFYECLEGFSLKTSNNMINCKDTGWDDTAGIECVRSECGPPPLVNNATWFLEGSRVVYSCSEGFVLASGSMSRKTCERGTWSNAEVTCVRDACQDPPEVENATPVFNSTVRGSVVAYGCEDGYRLTEANVNKRVCQEDRMWSTEDVKCQPTFCSPPPSLPNTDQTMSDNTTIGSVVEYRCKAGFYLNRSSSSPSNDDSNSFNDPVINGDILVDPAIIGVPPETTHTDAPDLNLDIIMKVECNTSVQWTIEKDVSGRCDPVECGDPPQVKNGVLTQPPSSTVFDSIVEYSCNVGFRLDSKNGTDTNRGGINNEKVCGEMGLWEGDVECSLIECPDENVDDMYLDAMFVGRRPGDIAVYNCFVGYEHLWFDRKICLDNGTWSTPKMKCQIIDCGVPPDIEFTNAPIYTTTTYGSEAHYNCIDGYVRTHSVKKRQCNRRGYWDSKYLQCKQNNEPSCQKISAKNSYETFTYTNLTEGGLAILTCDTGSYLSDKNLPIENTTESAKVCRSGRWEGQYATCVPVDCGSFPIVVNATATQGPSVYLSQVVYNCIQNNVMAGPNFKTCTDNGSWSNEIVECIHEDVVHCHPPPNVNHSVIRYESHTVNSTAIYTCQEGFIQNTIQLTCMSSGNWSGLEDFKCLPVDCQNPPSMPYTTLHVHATTLGHHAIYTCSMYNEEENHRPSRSQCQTNGNWSSVDSPCFHCLQPSQPPNTLNLSIPQTSSLHKVGENITYNCSDGYIRILSDDLFMHLTCNRGGEWLTNAPCVNRNCSDSNLVFGPNHVVHITSFDLDRWNLNGNYWCSQGFYIQGHRIGEKGRAVCDFTAGWITRYIFPCIEIDCGPPPAISHASILNDYRTTYQSEAAYTCDPTYIMVAEGPSVDSVCEQDGQWTSVNFTCVHCPTDVVITNGRLVEINVTSDPTNRSLRPPRQKAYVECHDDHLLYSTNGRVQSTVVCVEDKVGDMVVLEWDGLESLECVRNGWDYPPEEVAVRLDDSYALFNVCAEVILPTNNMISLSLYAFQDAAGTGTTQDDTVAFSAIMTKGSSRLDILQKPFQGAPYLEIFNVDFRDADVVCIAVHPETITYELWVDGSHVASVNEVPIPVSMVKGFQYNGQGLNVTRLEIRASIN